MLESSKVSHPKGEAIASEKEAKKIISKHVKFPVDTYGGRVHVEWDPQAAVTPLGQLAFFIEFLKLGNLFAPWVNECPLHQTSPNAASNRDILGSLLLSVLAGHTRYAHITALRCDNVNPNLLGMKKVVSEDSMRRSFLKIEEAEGIRWLQAHLRKCYQPLLREAWIMDIDTTVKVLYGKQEGAVIGYNPKKPGRPSHTYHTYMIANLRLILEAEVQSGNQSSSKYSAPDLWSLLEKLPRSDWPQFLRGDSNFGTEGVMREAEARGLNYLFKLRLSKNVKRLIERLMVSGGWGSAGQGWDGQEGWLQLMGWEVKRRVIVLRKKLPHEVMALSADSETGQVELNFGDTKGKAQLYEYAVLVTSLPDEIITIAQHYRERADCENVFDELKNQWGWGGFTTQDLKRCKLMARVVALIYNWWNIFVRLAEPDKHLEAITSRPLLLHAVGKQTSHAGQTIISISNMHGKIGKVQKLLERIISFFKTITDSAEQLTSDQLWYRILSKAVEKYLKGRILQPPNLLPASL